MALKLILFDLDGTLVDSSVDICAAVNHAIKPYGIPELTVEKTISLVGEGSTALVAKVLHENRLDAELSTVLKGFLAYYADHMADHAAPYREVPETLAALSGVKKAVVSNKLRAFSVQLLDALGLLRHLEYVAGGDTSGEKKPSPVPVFHVLSHFETEAHEALFVGDSVYDMKAAKAAGVRSVAVLYGFGSNGFSNGADFKIERFGELVDIVKGLGG